MAKRKSKAKAPPAKKAKKLETAFDCPFCNHKGSVDCSIDLKHGFAEASCCVCQESYSTSANALTEPVDVYSEWIDECERVNEGVEARRRGGDDDGDYDE